MSTLEPPAPEKPLTITVQPTFRRKLDKLLRDPVVSAVTLLATVGAIPLTIYLYFRPPGHRDLCYLVNLEKTVVVKEGQLSRLSVTLDGKPIASDVSAAQIVFWNDGNQAIRGGHVLEPLLLRTSPNVPIIDASIRKTTRAVVHPKIDTTNFNRGVLGLSWDILEENDGAALQVVFAGGTDTDLVATAVLEGQAAIRKVDEKAPRSQKDMNRQNLLLVIVIWVAFIAFLGIAFFQRTRSGRRDVVFTLALLISVGVVTVDFISSHWRHPPFGF
jgi:hypothetical protein